MALAQVERLEQSVQPARDGGYCTVPVGGRPERPEAEMVGQIGAVVALTSGRTKWWYRET